MSGTAYLSVAARRAGFRRAGRAWPAEPVIVATADFDAEQLDALRADPNIIVAPAEQPDDAFLQLVRDAVPETQTDPDLADVEYLSVTSRRAGFRRAGRAWPAEPVIVATAAFSAAQLDAIINEPNLIVARAEAPTDETPADERIDRLVAGVASMAQEAQAGDWTKSGKPTVEALERIAGLDDITAAERDRAVAIYAG